MLPIWTHHAFAIWPPATGYRNDSGPAFHARPPLADAATVFTGQLHAKAKEIPMKRLSSICSAITIAALLVLPAGQSAAALDNGVARMKSDYRMAETVDRIKKDIAA